MDNFFISILSCNQGSEKCTLGFLSLRNWTSSSRISLLSMVQVCCWEKRESIILIASSTSAFFIALSWLAYALSTTAAIPSASLFWNKTIQKSITKTIAFQTSKPFNPTSQLSTDYSSRTKWNRIKSRYRCNSLYKSVWSIGCFFTSSWIAEWALSSGKRTHSLIHTITLSCVHS